MPRLLEQSALLRTLNYVRVKHPYARRYNVIYPGILAFLTIIVIGGGSSAGSFFGAAGVISKLTQYLAVLSPFFLASLAAVSTFSGAENFDAPFKMREPVTLEMRGERGVIQPFSITPRHFLSLLFGYCCVVSMALFAVSIVAPLLSSAEGTAQHSAHSFVEVFAATIFFFFFYQVTVATLLGVYYLADKLHRDKAK